MAKEYDQKLIANYNLEQIDNYLSRSHTSPVIVSGATWRLKDLSFNPQDAFSDNKSIQSISKEEKSNHK